MMQRVAGLTWDHPRGILPLRELSRRARVAGEIDIAWEAHSLEGFESHPIADLAERYDLVIVDHPSLGDARKADCLVPVDRLFDAGLLSEWAESAVGASFQSYADGQGQWALPIDAAAQVMIYGEAVDSPPDSLDQLFAIKAKRRVVPCLAGPHAALMFMALCVGYGGPVATDLADPVLVDRATGKAALELIARLAEDLRTEDWGRNPIAIHEAMARGEIDLCPLVFGYVQYARPGKGLQRVRFADAIELSSGGVRGSVLGGTGLAITRRAKPDDALLGHVTALMSEPCQTEIVPAFSGQPYHRRAWSSEALNASAGGFYADTRRTLETAWVRPRWAGYTKFQGQISEVIRSGVASDAPADLILARLQDAYRTQQDFAGAP
jgi:multiple sugar transport system substrate-binding protein